MPQANRLCFNVHRHWVSIQTLHCLPPCLINLVDSTWAVKVTCNRILCFRLRTCAKVQLVWLVRIAHFKQEERTFKNKVDLVRGCLRFLALELVRREWQWEEWVKVVVKAGVGPSLAKVSVVIRQ